jgi:hypothetical protein
LVSSLATSNRLVGGGVGVGFSHSSGSSGSSAKGPYNLLDITLSSIRALIRQLGSVAFYRIPQDRLMSGGCWHRDPALQSGSLQACIWVEWSPAHTTHAGVVSGHRGAG